MDTMDNKVLSARLVSLQRPREAPPLDRVFVRDLVLDCEIGVFHNEKGVTQRVRFDVELEVRAHSAHTDDDIAKVISYDTIIDGIKAILGEGHINLVETLAERIAQFCLDDPRAVQVRVRVEKLDKEPGAVGVEIVRQAPPPEAANVYRPWQPSGQAGNR